MSIKGSPYARFRRALRSGSPTLVTAAASELPSLTLVDAMAVCLVYAQHDSDRFDRAIVRWHARFCLEARGMEPGAAQLALSAALALRRPEAPAAARVLAEICAQHRLGRVTDLLRGWAETR